VIWRRKCARFTSSWSAYAAHAQTARASHSAFLFLFFTRGEMFFRGDERRRPPFALYPNLPSNQPPLTLSAHVFTRDGFGDTRTLEGDPVVANAHLKTMTGKMAESKRLIKEFERVSREQQTGFDEQKVAATKKELVQKLNGFVNKKKAAQADVAARVANDAAAGGNTDRPSVTQDNGTASAFASASVATLAGRVGGSAGTGGAQTQNDPNAVALFGKASKASKAPTQPEEVSLQVMETKDIITKGRETMSATDAAIERSKKTVESTIQLGTQTAEALRDQTTQMERVVDDLDEIHFSLKKSFKVIRDLTRGLATDKCILTLLFLVVAGVVAIIVVKIMGVDENDQVIDVDPLNNQDSAPAAATRMSRRLLFTRVGGVDGWG